MALANSILALESQVMGLQEQLRCSDAFGNASNKMWEKSNRENERLKTQISEMQSVWKNMVCKHCVRPDRPCVCDVLAERLDGLMDTGDAK